MENSATAQLSARLLAILAISIGSCKSPASVSSVDSTASPRAPHRATDGTIADAHANGGPVDLCEDRFEMCRHFKDRQGDKTLILEQTQVENKIYNHIENEHQTYKSLQLTFRVMLGSTEQVRVFDRVRSCGENARASYLDQSLSITDLDEDGIKEVSFLYQMACYDDVVPAGMKLMLLEAAKKYKIRGRRHFFAREPGTAGDAPPRIQNRPILPPRTTSVSHLRHTALEPVLVGRPRQRANGTGKSADESPPRADYGDSRQVQLSLSTAPRNKASTRTALKRPVRRCARSKNHALQKEHARIQAANPSEEVSQAVERFAAALSAS